jgi:hypothetical protein
MCGMDFDHFEARCQGALRRSLPCLDIMFDSRFIQRYRDGVFVSEGYGAWADNRPPAFFSRLQTSPSFPWHLATRLTPGVGELDSRSRSRCFQESCDTRQGFDLFVLPNSDVTRRNAPIGRDRASLDDH